MKYICSNCSKTLETVTSINELWQESGRRKDQEELASISRDRGKEYTFMTVKKINVMLKGLQRYASAGQSNITFEAALDIHENTARMYSFKARILWYLKWKMLKSLHKIFLLHSWVQLTILEKRQTAYWKMILQWKSEGYIYC